MATKTRPLFIKKMDIPPKKEKIQITVPPQAQVLLVSPAPAPAPPAPSEPAVMIEETEPKKRGPYDKSKPKSKLTDEQEKEIEQRRFERIIKNNALVTKIVEFNIAQKAQLLAEAKALLAKEESPATPAKVEEPKVEPPAPPKVEPPPPPKVETPPPPKVEPPPPRKAEKPAPLPSKPARFYNGRIIF